MEEFLSKTPQTQQRIAFHVNFPDYNQNELMDILKLMAKNKNMKQSKKAIEKTKEIFKEAVKVNDFGNGRFVRNLLENATMGMAQRLAQKNFNKLTDKQLTTIEDEDLVMPVMTAKIEKNIHQICFQKVS